MTRQTKTTKSEHILKGKGKVTPLQVAFIVDRYLADNNFAATRSLFRSEASTFLTKTRAREAPKHLLSLAAMLDEYICLKEQKVMVDQAKCQLDQEKTRVQTLFQGLQNLLNTFNSSAAPACLTPPLQQSFDTSMVPSMATDNTALQTPLVSSALAPDHVKRIDSSYCSNPAVLSNPPRKRKCSPVPQIHGPSKKSHGIPSNNQSTSSGRLEYCSKFGEPQDHVQGSSLENNLFNQPSSQSPNSNSSGPKTPQRSVSTHTGKYVSPPEEIYSTAKSNAGGTSLETTPTNCTIISSKTIIVNSPAKNFSAYNSPSKAHLMTHSKRDHVKGRLDFDATDLPMISENTNLDVCTTSDSDRDGDLFDLDLDALGPDFSLSELLIEFGIDCGDVDFSYPEASADPLSGPINLPHEGDFRFSQDLIDQDFTMKDNITSVRSITQCIQLVSPAKKATSYQC